MNDGLNHFYLTDLNFLSLQKIKRPLFHQPVNLGYRVCTWITFRLYLSHVQTIWSFFLFIHFQWVHMKLAVFFFFISRLRQPLKSPLKAITICNITLKIHTSIDKHLSFLLIPFALKGLHFLWWIMCYFSFPGFWHESFHLCQQFCFHR